MVASTGVQSGRRETDTQNRDEPTRSTRPGFRPCVLVTSFIRPPVHDGTRTVLLVAWGRPWRTFSAAAMVNVMPPDDHGLPRPVKVLMLWLGAITAVLTVANQYKSFVGSSPPAVSQAEMQARLEAQRAQHDKEEAERKIADAQRLADERAKAAAAANRRAQAAELLRKNADFKAAIERIKPKHFVNGKAAFHEIAFINPCDFTISVALRYKAINDRWVTQGWWVVESGQTRTTSAVTRNSILYFYASGGGRIWEGKKGERASRPIVSLPFIQVEDAPLEAEGRRDVVFMQMQFARDESGPYSVEFSCQ